MQEEVLAAPPVLPDLQRYAPPASPQAHPDALERAADMLTDATYPVIIADLMGRHLEAVDTLIQLAESLACPVIDRGGRYNFPNTHPLNFTDSADEILPQADVVLALDVLDLFGALGRVDKATRLFQSAITPQTQIIHITMGDMFVRSWASDYERLPAVDLPVTGDTAVALPALLTLCQARLSHDTAPQRTARAEQLGQRHQALREAWRQQAQQAREEHPIAVATATAEIWEVIKDEDWVLVNNAVGAWTRRLWEFDHPGCHLGTSGGAGLGYGMGEALGGVLGHRESGKLCINLGYQFKAGQLEDDDHNSKCPAIPSPAVPASKA